MEERKKAQAEEIAAALAHVRLRPGMHFSVTDLSHLWVFITAFSWACNIFEIDIAEHENAIWVECDLKAHDWQERINMMEERGMTETQIIAEWLGVLILSIQRTYGISGEKLLEIHRGVRQRSTNEQDIQAIDSLESAMGVSSRDL